MLSLDGTLPWWRAEEFITWNVCYSDTNSNFKQVWMWSGIQREVCPTFLTSLVSMQRSIRSTVEMSMYSLHTSFIHLVKLSTVVSKSSQVNFIMLNTRLIILSEGREKNTTILHSSCEETGSQIEDNSRKVFKMDTSALKKKDRASNQHPSQINNFNRSLQNEGLYWEVFSKDTDKKF